MKLSDILTVADNPHAKQHSYGNDFFTDDHFREITTPSLIREKHIVISRDRHVFNNTLNLPFDDSNTILTYPESLKENNIHYLQGLIIGSKKHTGMGINHLLGLSFPDMPAAPTAEQLKIIYATKELNKVICEIHNIKADFYRLYHATPAHRRLNDYIHLSHIKLSEIITEGAAGEDIHFEQSGIVAALDSRDKVVLSRFRVLAPVEKHYLLLLSAINNNLHPTTHIHSSEEIAAIMNELSQRHKVVNISLQRYVEDFLIRQIIAAVLKLSNA